MPITPDERRFLRSWEEQRRDGRKAFLGIYTFGLSILLFLAIVALGLFMGLPFVRFVWLIGALIVAIGGAVALSFYIWNRQERRFRGILQRVLREHGGEQAAQSE